MLSDLRHRLRALFRPSAVERDLDVELQFHLEQQVEHDARFGIPRNDALRRARHDLGGLEQVKEACRDERGVSPIERARQDAGQALCVLKRRPTFTATVIVTLALGIGVTTTTFSVVDSIVLRSLPYPEADRIVQIGASFGGVRVSSLAAPDVLDLAQRAQTLQAVAATKPQTLDLTGEGAPERLQAAAVSSGYFDVLRTGPAIGQAFSRDLDRPGAAPVAIISHGLWMRRLNSDQKVLGRQLVLNDVSHIVIGVMPAGFRGPDVMSQRNIDLWIPAGRVDRSVADRGDLSWGTLARLADGVDLRAATTEAEALAKALTLEHPKEDARQFWVSPLATETVGESSRQLWLIFVAVSLLWLIACANMANLFLVRTTERVREMAVRAALGAGRVRVARQLLAETGICALAGGLLGSGLAYVSVGLLRAYGPVDLPRLEDVVVDARVLAFTFGLSLIAGLGFGVVPAWEAMKLAPAGGLRGGTATTGTGRLRLRNGLVVVQTALALVLTIGAALLANSLIRLAAVDPGFDPTNVVWMEVGLPPRTYPTPASRTTFFDEALHRLHGVPGVVVAAGIAGRPLGGGNAVSTVFPEGELPAKEEDAPRVPFHSITPGYFRTLKIPLVDGRDFTSGDDTSAPRVAIVSRAFADRFWPGERAVGKRFWMGRIAADAPLTLVVGVVEDVRQYGLDRLPIPMVYRSIAQVPRPSLGLVVKHDGRATASLLQTLRQAVWTLDTGLPLDEFGTMDEHVRGSIAEPRFRALVLSAIGASAAALAFVGLYSTLSWVVRARRRELCIRITLGANAGEIQRLVIGRGAKLAVIGLGLGTLAGIFASRLLSSMVFGITATDAPTFACAIAGMSIISIVASWIPARRAAVVDPVATLRDE